MADPHKNESFDERVERDGRAMQVKVKPNGSLLLALEEEGERVEYVARPDEQLLLLRGLEAALENRARKEGGAFEEHEVELKNRLRSD